MSFVWRPCSLSEKPSSRGVCPPVKRAVGEYTRVVVLYWASSGGGGRNQTEDTDSYARKIAGFIRASSRIFANSLTTFLNSVSARTDSFTDTYLDNGGGMKKHVATRSCLAAALALAILCSQPAQPW